jgi:hypothetical protein
MFNAERSVGGNFDRAVTRRAEFLLLRIRFEGKGVESLIVIRRVEMNEIQKESRAERAHELEIKTHI